MSLIYGYSGVDNADNTVREFTTTVTFTNYNYQKFVKVFDRGIVLLDIITSQNKVHSGDVHNVYYNFCSVDGSTQVKPINVLKNNSDDKVLDAYTNLDACSITAKLVSEDKGGPQGKPREKKLARDVKTSITLRYIELSTSINESNIWL